MLIGILIWVLSAATQSPCRCVGAESGSDPLIVLDGVNDGPGLTVCGHLESRGPVSVRASELDVFSCGSDTPILHFGALETVELQRRAGTLVITEIDRWPFGPKWQWIDVPVWRYVVEPGDVPVISKTLVLQPPRLTSRQASEAIAPYERARATKRHTERYEDIIGRVLLAALAGHARARWALEHMSDAVALDGHSAEVWRGAIDLYQLYARTTGKVPLIPGM
jgi:hypothetical protein